MLSLVLFGTFLLFLFLNVPIGFSLGLASIAAILYSDTISVSYIAQNLVTSTDSFPLMAVPFFILAGELMDQGGISKRLLNVASIFFGRCTGGLAIVTIVACMFFAAISGSGPATVAAIGGIMIPAMVSKGYSKKFSAALVATSGSIGVMIPPSIPMVIYGVSTENSISTLFFAGFVPGIIIGIGLIVWSYLYSKRKGYVGDDSTFTIFMAWGAINEAKWALLSPVIILGGIYGGIFTPTEAAAVAVLYGLLVGTFIHRELKLPNLYQAIKNSALTSATIMIIIGTATTFGKILTLERIPVMIADGIASFSSNTTVVLLLIIAVLLFVGCFMETLAAIIILSPILLPIVTNLGVDPIHFGIIMVVALAIGFITPPLGVNLFVACGISKISLEDISKGILPFVFVMVSLLLLVVFFPQISLLLPRIYLSQ